MYETILFLHVLTAFAVVSAQVVFWTVAVAARNVDRPVDSLRYFQVARPANILIIVGTLGTLVFGIWLAIDADAYQVWDAWILGAIVLWAIASATGQRSGKTYTEAQQLAARLAAEGRAEESSQELRTLLKDRTAMWLNIVSTAAVLLILIDMIYKPGAGP